MILDEVQFAPALLSAIKRRVDLSSEAGRYFLTGSQNLNMLKKSVSETMTGRVVLLHMEAMSLLERAGLSDQESWLVRYLQAPDQFIKERPSILPIAYSLPEII